MAAFDPATLDRWRALAIVDRDGTTVGTISEFYLDRETGYPTWALVDTGLLGTTQTFVPLVHATEITDGLQVPYEKSHIKDTPRVDLHNELSPEEEATLFAHYGVEYEPSPEEPEAETTEVAAEPGTVVGSGPAGSGDTEVAEGPGPVATEPATDKGPGGTASASGTTEETGPPVAAEPGAEGPGPVPAEPGTDDAAAGRDHSGPDAADDVVPDEPGTAEPEEATRVDQQGLRSEVVEPGEFESAAERREDQTEADPDLSRTAPVEPGLPGSTAAAPYGPGPTTIDKDAAPSEHPAEAPAGSPGEAGWPATSAGSFEEQVPLDRPAASSDRWREAKLAAERERASRPPAAAQSEERSPLERARRRLERLVGVGQEHTDPEDVSPADRDAAERARRARLGLDEDDNRKR
jgi:PRC-barrel domain protein